LLSTVDRCRAAAASAGLAASVFEVAVPFPELSPRDLVDWRLGMAMHAPFVERLPPREVATIRRRALAALGDDCPPLVRTIVLAVARV
jgi:hypothetical protein